MVSEKLNTDTIECVEKLHKLMESESSKTALFVISNGARYKICDHYIIKGTLFIRVLPEIEVLFGASTIGHLIRYLYFEEAKANARFNRDFGKTNVRVAFGRFSKDPQPFLITNVKLIPEDNELILEVEAE